MIKAMKNMNLFQLILDEIIAIVLFMTLAFAIAAFMDGESIIKAIIDCWTDRDVLIMNELMEAVVVGITLICRVARITKDYLIEYRYYNRKSKY